MMLKRCSLPGCDCRDKVLMAEHAQVTCETLRADNEALRAANAKLEVEVAALKANMRLANRAMSLEAARNILHASLALNASAGEEKKHG